MTHYDAKGAQEFFRYVLDKIKSITGAAENLRNGSPVELGYLLEKTEDLLRFLEREYEIQNGHKTEHARKLAKYEIAKENIDTLEKYLGFKLAGYIDLPTEDSADAVDETEKTPCCQDKFGTRWYRDNNGCIRMYGEDKSKFILM